MAGKCKTSQVIQSLRFIDGQERSSFTLSDLVEVKLPGWPSVSADFPELETNWTKAENEARRHLDDVFCLKIRSPYPINSYCLGEAAIDGSKLKLCYLLFPNFFPEKLTHAIAQVVFETSLDADAGYIEKCWMDALRKEELSEDNKRHLKQQRELSEFGLTKNKRKKARSKTQRKKPSGLTLVAH